MTVPHRGARFLSSHAPCSAWATNSLISRHVSDEERKVLTELSALVAEEFESLNQLVVVLLQLDLALARGRYGRWLGGAVPVLDAPAMHTFELRDLRHPC